jgi:hypothetical protein
VGDGQLGHVVALVAERDEIVVDAGLVLVRVVEVELFRLDVVGRQLFDFELCNLGEEALLLGGRHAPYYYDAIVKEEHLGRVHGDVKVGCLVGEFVVLYVVKLLDDNIVGALVAFRKAVRQGRMACLAWDVDQVASRMPSFWVRVYLDESVLAVVLHLLRAVAVGRVDALVDQLGVRPLALAPPFQPAL